MEYEVLSVVFASSPEGATSRRLKRREREFWEHPIVAARTLECAYCTLYGRLREDERGNSVTTSE